MIAVLPNVVFHKCDKPGKGGKNRSVWAVALGTFSLLALLEPQQSKKFSSSQYLNLHLSMETAFRFVPNMNAVSLVSQ